jgi:hypothetical protein
LEDTKKIDKFMKMITKWKIFDQGIFGRKDKIIVWLDQKKQVKGYYNKIVSKISHSGPKIIIFYKVNEMYLFLNYLFKIKPQYKTKVADAFRIIIENKEEINKDRIRVCQTDASEMLLNWLSAIGTRVPTLIFHLA